MIGRSNSIFALFLSLSLVFFTACDSSSVDAKADSPASGSSPAAGEPGSEAVVNTLQDLEAGLDFKLFRDPWTGDLDRMVEKRLIRVLTVYGLGRYFLDDGEEKGIVYESFKSFEKHINEQLQTGNLKVHVAFLPVARDELIPALLAGRGDIVAAQLTITPERLQRVDFTDPFTRELSEVLVTGPAAPRIDNIEDLAGADVNVRLSSSYYSSLQELNRSLSAQGLETVNLIGIDETLEDEDILEMVSAGLLPWAVVDDYKATIWAGVFSGLTVRKDLVLRSGGRIGYAIRKDSPRLMTALNGFLETRGQGTLDGNILINRYFRDYEFAGRALANEDFGRLQSVIELFETYGGQYGVDFLLVAAQGYQESRLDQSMRSPAGAIGIMQLLPSTARDPNVGIPDITRAEPNIHAGIKYLNFIRNRYFSEPGIDRFNQTLFAMAAYNAGPARITGLREKAAEAGYDPNVWFDNVEVMAASEIGRETVDYVANILKYYVAYNSAIRQELKRGEARRRASGED